MIVVHTIGRRLSAILLLIMLTACEHQPRPYDVEIIGCGTARVHHTPSRDSAVIDATVDGCPGVPAPAARVARIVWLGLAQDVEAMRVRTAGPSSTPTVLSRTELEHEFGVRHRPDRGHSDSVWLLLPLGLAATVAVTLLIARGARQAGVLVVFAARR